MRVAIIGLGHIGGSLAKDIRHKKIATEILGIDTCNTSLTQALDKNIITSVGNWESVKTVDWVILSTPVDIIETMIKQVLNRVSPKTLVMDVGSTKSNVVEAVRDHPNRKNFVAAHPIAGKEFSGVEGALDGLFEDKVCILCDTEDSKSVFVTQVEKIFEKLGCRLLYMNAREHDQHIAYVSHLSHISSFALSNTVLELEKKEKNILNLAGSGFESTVRLAKSNPDMWSAIFEKNQEHVSTALNAYIDQLKIFQKILTQHKPKEDFKKYISISNRIKKILN